MKPSPSVDVAFTEMLDEERDVHPDRATLDAERVLALQAAVGFQQCELFGEPEVDLGEADGPLLRILLGHLLALDLEALLGGDFAIHESGVRYRLAPGFGVCPIRQSSPEQAAFCSNSR